MSDAVLALDSLVVGWRSGNSWKQAGPEFGRRDGALSYRAFGLGTVGGSDREASARYEEVDHACYLSVPSSFESPLFHGRKPSVPRPVRSLDPGSPVYRKVLQAFLDGHGMSGAVARIVRIVQADLDGDGTYEVIIEARSRDGLDSIPPNKGWTKADYSLVLLRCIRGGKVVETPLELTTMAKKNTMELDRLRGVADLDGDGRIEILTDGKGYEWHQATLWTYRRGTARSLVSTYSGQ